MTTIFTPTYNRKYIISHLYESLCNQTCKNFEWLIVDDGSTDGTETLIKEYIAQNFIQIKYFYTQNGGKSCAINYGVKNASGKYFFIVDSDDYLTENAVELIQKNDSYMTEKTCGICFSKKNYRTGNTFGNLNQYNGEYKNSLELAFMRGGGGY